MLLRSKHQLKDAPVKFRSFKRSKVETFKEVCVKNPTTKQDETVSLAVVQDEYVLPHNLRASDFSLEVQIRAGVQLQQMPNYLQPSSPEEYDVYEHLYCWYHRNLYPSNIYVSNQRTTQGKHQGQRQRIKRDSVGDK